MDKNIIYRDVSDGDITICRSLCNRLMEHQAQQTENELYREIFSTMCYENRLLPSFQNATERQLIIAYGDLFSAVVHHIIGQQISTKAQQSIWNKMLPI